MTDINPYLAAQAPVGEQDDLGLLFGRRDGHVQLGGGPLDQGIVDAHVAELVLDDLVRGWVRRGVGRRYVVWLGYGGVL